MGHFLFLCDAEQKVVPVSGIRLPQRKDHREFSGLEKGFQYLRIFWEDHVTKADTPGTLPARASAADP
jgi:hypothetical protein